MSTTAHDPSNYDLRDVVPVRRALISVSDKTGLPELATALSESGVEIVSTGSTAAMIRASGHAVTDVSEVTGFPESLDGRVKTLHPAIHAGILADLRLASHREQLQQRDIAAFELVVVNLYPFRETVAGGADVVTVVENIDIGGPALVRAAAKNYANVAIVVDPADYSHIAAALGSGGTTLAARRSLAARAFAHTASYDSAVASWFAHQQALDEEKAETFPGSVEIVGNRQQVLRYGENSHQEAALYVTPSGTGIAQATQLHGKEMSYNNYVDADAAVRAAYDFVLPAVAIVKHANPCGIAVADRKAIDPIASAHRRAHECDPVSAFGGVIAANRPITLAMAETVKEIFTEVVIAPGFEPEALAVLTAKKNVRLLQLPDMYAPVDREFRQISGGFLVQQPDRFVGGLSEVSSGWQRVAGAPADSETLRDLEFAWKACRAVKSNAILLASGGASVGIGMGQVNRVDSCQLAVTRAGERAAGSVAASDAFFPFADGLEVLLAAGVKAVVQPGGSVRDAEVIAAAVRAGVTMYTTGERHFFH
ncbi:bifunctional phosphoribosylaminoimidazolecarboxamide formyltransferase/IMP cyclohydrolase [Rathayibacter toxicus]|uniref:Bifunctional purine biosynthesis protein PurH n=1 Tax=Rathayibacter toxicus TaxID=145458 RepID=A0A2S5Y8Y8_9MICO|nr:bifunctional phosphoribosylaminoimidazolecarboxamide formyltransferase/IMP cyclohydrolase [Rathayibacter toxicus]PPH24930.1 bifunctional phosphoribosylaminoimidazolecarboxamide formyltransferase/IMP cyclohydrolase PurH [Rathayibacter toxicus]PPH58854.1 bifunctional phosphoribosylaminoimidazolecarboxamide formyltransferase/IMP cyclohydrolase PurH [Rathayibacter toxicus]PPH60850.1 bifunctional phosphoribosylaminoimidazolecarboxamide formyltransferase/IMP cyclohydrolase PurH [Rathayibacter toxic